MSGNLGSSKDLSKFQEPSGKQRTVQHTSRKRSGKPEPADIPDISSRCSNIDQCQENLGDGCAFRRIRQTLSCCREKPERPELTANTLSKDQSCTRNPISSEHSERFKVPRNSCQTLTLYAPSANRRIVNPDLQKLSSFAHCLNS